MNIKSPIYPAVIVFCLLGLVGLVLISLQFSVSIEPIEPETSSIPEKLPEKSREPKLYQRKSPSPAIPTPAAQPTTSVKQNTPVVSNAKPNGIIAGQGALRVSNQTEQPLRVVLLAPQSAVNASNSKQSAYGKPVHWDFAPGEGSRQGLILSLPDGNLQLKKGDILVVFAQDGSRRYWGPYVVGETAAPVWNPQTSEWQIIL